MNAVTSTDQTPSRLPAVAERNTVSRAGAAIRLERLTISQAVREAIGQLPAREQQILLLRFYGERTQSEISEALGISQVHVSRVLSRTLAAIRDHVMYDLPLPVAGPRRAAVAS